MAMSSGFIFFLIQLLNGVQLGLLLFLVASGLTLIFGIMGVINLAHGSFYMLGAYLVYAIASFTGDLWTAILIAVPLAIVLGLALEALLIRPLYGRDHLYQVLLTYGLILVLEEIRSLLFGDDVHGVAVPAFLDFSVPLKDALTYPAYRLFLSAFCLVIAGAMWWLIRYTRLGMAIRAGSTNREMVQSLGIDIDWVYRAVFALGVALAALAGMIAAPVASVFPGMGNDVLIVSFVVVVIGGIGSIYVPQLSGMTIYVLMAAVLLWRPAGLFGRA